MNHQTDDNRAAQTGGAAGEEEDMKKWMALLLCCLLCWCAAGAMAEEPVTLNIYENICYDIYPNGYIRSDNPGVLVPHTGSYIFTGVSVGQSEKPLSFYANAYGKEPGNNQNVSYDVTFKALEIAADPDCTAIRFFADGVDANVENCKITINLSSINDGVGKPHFVHASSCPAFNNNQPENNNTVEILVHNVSGTLEFGRDGSHNENIVSRGVTLTYDDEDGQKVTIDGNVENDPNNDENLWIRTSSCPYHLTYQPTTATCTAAGKQGYYTCTICKRIYLNENATGETTLADLPEAGPLGHNLTLVPAKPATCTEDGYEAYYVCTRCQELFVDENATMVLPQPKPIPAEGHDFGEDWQSDGEKHWHACDCGERSGEAEHSFVTVVDRKPGETEPGEQHEECSVCGYRKAAVSIPAVGRIDLPQTGDSSHLLGWLAMLGACCAGLWCVSRRRG